MCVVYCVDSLFVTDAAKLIAGNLTALAAMVHLELPHINLLTKCDLVDKGALERYLAPSGDALAGELARATGPRFKALNKAIARILDDYDMVRRSSDGSEWAGLPLIDYPRAPSISSVYRRAPIRHAPYRNPYHSSPVSPIAPQVSFIPCDITDEEGLEAVLLQVDHAIQVSCALALYRAVTCASPWLRPFTHRRLPPCICGPPLTLPLPSDL